MVEDSEPRSVGPEFGWGAARFGAHLSCVVGGEGGVAVGHQIDVDALLVHVVVMLEHNRIELW